MDPILMRLMASFFAGVALSLSGSLIQATFNNKLASPSTLGLDAIIVFVYLIFFLITNYFFADYTEWLALLTVGFLICGTGINFLLFNKLKKFFFTKTGLMLLVGLGINLLVGSFFSIYQFVSEAIFISFPRGIWFGNFKQITSIELFIFIPIVLVILVVLLREKRVLVAQTLNAELLLQLQPKWEEKKIKFITLSFILTTLVISFFGVFSFLSLVFPHILRLIAKKLNRPDFEYQWGILASGLSLMLLDFLCYQFPIWGAEIPVGMLASLLGAFGLISLLTIELKR